MNIGGLEEHELERSEQNPIVCKPVHDINPRYSQPAYLPPPKTESCCNNAPTKLPSGNVSVNNLEYNIPKEPALPIVSSTKCKNKIIVYK